MKLLKKSIFLLLAGVLVLTSCKDEKANLQLSAIPSDAFFVVAIENQKMVKKGGLGNLSDYKFFQKLQDEMKNDINPAVQEIVDELMKNPKSSGLDTEKAYIYGSVVEDGIYCVFNYKMDNQSAFEKKVKELFESQNKPLPEVENLGGVKLISHGDKFVVAWNEDLLLLFIGERSSLDYKSFFEIPADKSIMSVADFATFQKEPYDIACWMAYSDFLTIFEKIGSDITMPAYMQEFADTYFHGYVNFNDGEIRATGKMSPQSKVDDFNKKYPIIKKDINTVLLEDFPDKSYFLTSMSVNWDEYFKLFSENMAQMGKMQGMMDAYEEILSNPTAKTILDIFDGDLVFSLYNFAQGPFPIPLAGLSFTLKNESDFDRFLGLFPQNMLTKNGDYYVMATPFMVTLNIACKDKRVLITDDADAVASFVGKGFSSNLKNSEMANELKKSPVFFYMNLDLETYPESLKALIAAYSTSEINAGLKVLEPMKDVSYYATEKSEIVFSLKFKDSKQNSLKTLLKSVDNLAPEM